MSNIFFNQNFACYQIKFKIKSNLYSMLYIQGAPHISYCLEPTQTKKKTTNYNRYILQELCDTTHKMNNGLPKLKKKLEIYELIKWTMVYQENKKKDRILGTTINLQCEL
eukprot:TRINITY_DN434_c1_g1_i3.p4 TRINITY_DN434_c1_g1~~TRINITY_DN434_c1_g1_i3.p4  ORF type:complete len:110 (-),score=4.88 TRINITY_DN434_c1_g1_i3:858-1187(-)